MKRSFVERTGQARGFSHLSLCKVDAVLLVGGSTHVPLIARMIEEEFTSPGLPIHTKLPKPIQDEQDMAAGYGAAIAAAHFGIKYIDTSRE